LETGKIIDEGEGEVQEMIDICDFAVGQSRMLYGLTIQSERPSHRLMEQWQPLGVVAVISAFNFPVAVWSWNAALAAVCGDATVWKPSEKTPLAAIVVTKIAERVCRETGADPAIFTLLLWDRKSVGQKLADKVRKKLLAAYKSLPIGNPLDQKTLMGPLIDKGAVDAVLQSIEKVKKEGGEVLYGGERLDGEQYSGGCYMTPCLVNAKPEF